MKKEMAYLECEEKISFTMKILLVTVDLDALLALLYYFGAI